MSYLASHAEANVTRAQIGHFFNELRRRKVLRVLAGYAVGAWGLLQLADIVVPAIDLSEHYVLYVLMVLLAGFPIALALSWRYEFTATGLKLTTPDDEKPAAPSEPSATRRGDAAIAAVAVLPFENLTPATPRSYLAMAIPLELQSLLSRMHDLRVVSRQSSVAHTNTQADLPKIARELNVNYVISGSVADLGSRLQINVQLDDAVEDTLLWSERYDVQADHVEQLPREISEKVVATFGGERMRADIKRANDASAADGTAWQLVQRARSYVIDYTPASIAAAIPLLRQAVERDPKYALAYAQLAQVTAEKILNGISSDPPADRTYALEMIRRAEQLAPRDPLVLRASGCVHAFIGSYARSIELLRRTVKMSPYDLGTWGYFGWPLVATGKPENLTELHEIMDRLLTTAPRHPGRSLWQFHKSVAYACSDECERALELAEDYTAENPRFTLGLMHYANVLGRLGRAGEARAAADRSADQNPLMDPSYYAELMASLTDQPTVVERRTSGLIAAGLLDPSKVRAVPTPSRSSPAPLA
jgi:TolB-like protein